MKLVITEKNSVEGYAAAWIAKRMLKSDCEIVMMGQGDKLPENVKGRDVLIFGVSFSRNLVLKLAKEVGVGCVFMLFDNDLKARQELSGIKEVKLNMRQTAARMAWEYLRADFTVKIGPEKKNDYRFLSAPWIVDYSENEKLWKWPALNPYFIKTAIENCYKQELESWDELASRDLEAVSEQGKEFLKNKQKEEVESGRGAEESDRDDGGQTSRRTKKKQ